MNFIFVNIGMMMFRGGGENYAMNMARVLRQQGHKVELYTLKPIFSKATLSIPDVFDDVHIGRSPWLYPITSLLHRFGLTRRLKGIRGIPRYFGQMIFELLVFYHLWRRRSEDYSVISCGLSLVSFLVTRFLGKKGLLRMPGPIANSYDRYFGIRSAEIIANGNAYHRIRMEYAPPNLHFVNVGVQHFETPDDAALERMRKMLDLQSGMLGVLFVGRLIEIKNISMLLRGFSRLLALGYSAKLLIVGDGSDAEVHRSMASKLGLDDDVLFLGWRDREELGLIYRLADVCVLTSHYDNYPNVFIEAMACGTPCIGTSVGGIPDIVHPGINGELVQPDDHEGLSKTLIDFAKGDISFDRDVLQRQTLESYSWEQSAHRLVEIVSS